MGGGRGGKRPTGPREVLDTFKAVTMTEEDLKDEGSGKTKVTTKTVSERTWYTPEAWEHGGLRIKNEVKDEMEEGMDDGPQKKKAWCICAYWFAAWVEGLGAKATPKIREKKFYFDITINNPPYEFGCRTKDSYNPCDCTEVLKLDSNHCYLDIFTCMPA